MAQLLIFEWPTQMKTCYGNESAVHVLNILGRLF